MCRRRLAARKLAQVVLAAAGLATTRAAEAQFPITESFQNADPGTWILTRSAQFTSGNGDPAGQGWLRLTDASSSGHEAGSAIYKTPFSSAAGIVVTFTYATYGGTIPGADGFSFYLIDGATSSPTPGADGGSLGYSVQYWSGCGGPFYEAGVTNGYVGIGFDEYGDFSDCGYGLGGPGLTPDTVAIRGSGSGLDATGFRYLSGTQVSSAPFFQNIGTGSRVGARLVRISIINQKIEVEVDFGSGYRTIIDQYDLAKAAGQAAHPPTFKMGLGGSTGWFTNYHEFRNLKVAMPATLTLTHAATPATISVGESVTYTVTVSNDDTNAVNAVAFSDPVPAGIAGVTWTAATAGGAGVSSPSGSGNDITSTLDLPKNSSVTFTVTGTASAAVAGTTVTHTAAITPPPSISDLGNGSASASVVVSPMPSGICQVQADCAGGEVCVRQTRRDPYGFCQPPSPAASGGCSGSATGVSAELALLIVLGLAWSRRATRSSRA